MPVVSEMTTRFSQLLGSLAVMRFGSTLALCCLFDLGSKLLVTSRVCLVREHVYCVECRVKRQCEQPNWTAEPVEITCCTPCLFDGAWPQNLWLNTCFWK